MFDEWNFNNLQGEGVAVNEFLKKHQDEYETIHVKHTTQPSLMIKKIKHY